MSGLFAGIVQAVLHLIAQYGYLAVFVYLMLETANLLPFVPSEVVVPIAAGELVHDPLSFVLFVLDTTAGATVGSLLAYLVFRRYGEDVLDEHGHVIRISRQHLERSQEAFTRYGESMVFWGRLLPVLRGLVSIPAGLAEMDLRRFTIYSAVGAALFNTSLTYLVYTGAGTASPFGVVLNAAGNAVAEEATYVRHHPRFTIIVVGILVFVAMTVWLARTWIRSNPKIVKAISLHVIRLVGLFVGGVFILGALSAPTHAFGVITSVWDNPLFWIRLGFSEQISLVLTGALVILTSLIAYEVGSVLTIARVRGLTAHLKR